MRNLIESNPIVGFVAVIVGGSSVVLAWLQIISIGLGVVGGSFGCMAGFYTWKIQRLKWKRMAKDLDSASTEPPSGQ